MKKPSRLRSFLRWVFWTLVVQVVLLNISAAIYAYRFTHLLSGQPPQPTQRNWLQQTWHLYTGPHLYRLPHAASPGFATQTLRFFTADSTPIAAWYHAADSSKTCVVLVHGVTANKSFMLPEATAFVQKGFGVLLLDLRNHGNSGGNKHSFGVAETEELAIAEKFVRQHGYQQIVFYGVSMGADLVLRAAAKNIIQPNAVVADMPFASLRHHLQARARMLGFPAEPYASLVSFWTGLQNGYNGFGNSAVDYAGVINCPVLLQWGSIDGYVTKEENDLVWEELSSSQKMRMVYEGAGHESLLLADSNRWQNTMDSFLNRMK